MQCYTLKHIKENNVHIQTMYLVDLYSCAQGHTNSKTTNFTGLYWNWSHLFYKKEK